MGEESGSAFAAQLSALADAAFPRLELLAKRLGAAARPYLRLLSSAYEGVPDEMVGFVVGVFFLWILVSFARHYFSRGAAASGVEAEAEADAKAEAEAKDGSDAVAADADDDAGAGADAAEAKGKSKGGKPGAAKAKGVKPGDAKKADDAEAKGGGGSKKAGCTKAAAAEAEAEAAGRKSGGGLFAPLRAAAAAVDKRLEAYTAEIALAVWFARLAVGAGLFAYGIAAKFGSISFREHFDDGELSAEEVAEAEAIWVRFSSTAAVGLGVIVLLPALLPMPKKGQQGAPAPPPEAMHPADELLRS